MAIKLFTIGDDLELVINKVELLGIPSFRTLIKKVVPTEGDADGRKKEWNKKVLLYIYHRADLSSYPNRKQLGDKEAKAYAKSHAGLPFLFEEDDEIKAAIADYILEQSNLGSETTNELIRMFNLTQKIIRKSRESVEKLLDKNELSKEEVKDMLAIIETAIQYSSDVPEIIRALNKAMKEYELKDSSNVERLRGSKVPVPDSAIPGRKK